MFINITPIYHQICFSDFVTSVWIDFLLQYQLLDFWLSLYYQTNLSTQFRLLSTFCESVQQTVNDTLRVFLQSKFVSSQVIAQQILDLKIHSLIEDWQLNTINRYQYVIQLIRAINQGNQLMSAFFNVKIHVNETSNQVSLTPLQYSNCSCVLSGSCRIPVSTLYVDLVNATRIEFFTIPNFFTGCFPVDALLQSTLECFYNRTCVTGIITYLNPHDNTSYIPFNVSTLSITGQWPNKTTETVESIVNRLMVESWLRNISFASYYNACAPISCVFEYINRRDRLTIIITLIGIFGGLSTGLQILTLIVIRFAEKMIDGYFHFSLMQFIRNVFIPHNEQQMGRRLHFVLVLISLAVLYLISLLPSQLITVQITKPSLSIY
jgi:hypothetical protein